MAYTIRRRWRVSEGSGGSTADAEGGPSLQGFGTAGSWANNNGQGWSYQYIALTSVSSLSDFNGASAWTAVVVFTTGSTLPVNGEPLFEIGAATPNADIRLGMTTEGGPTTVIRVNGTTVAVFDSEPWATNTQYVVSIVFDSNEASNSDRVRVKVNGSVQSLTVNAITLGTTVSFNGSTSEFKVGFPFGNLTGWRLNYLVLATGAATPTETGNAYTNLAADNDFATDPFAAAGGGDIEVDTGLASETDAAQARTLQKQRAVGVATESSTAVARSLSKARSAGLASESDTAVARALAKWATPGVALELDAALSGGLRLPTRQATETDAAVATAISKRLTIGLAAETNAASALDADKRASVGLASEADAALDLDFTLGFAAGAADETDAAVSRNIDKRLAGALASETDSALARSLSRRVATGSASETDAARAVSFALTVRAAFEVDTAQALSIGFSVEAANENDSALALSLSRQVATGRANESSTASGVGLTKQRAPGVATETDFAFSLYSGVPEGYPTVTSWTVGDRPTVTSWARAEAPSVSNWSRGIAA